MIVNTLESQNTLGFGTNLGITVDNRTFSTLIDGIYTNKLLSVIREIGTNAKDSHIKAGIQDPYEIIIYSKNGLSADRVEFKDKGVGLSYEECKQYLCTLNSSSKRDDDTQTGFFGIGSKSPYSISNTFEYTCVKDGLLTFASFFKIDNVVPQVDVLEPVPTEQPNGVSCLIYLNKETQSPSIATITSSIFYSLIYFPIKPKVTLRITGREDTLIELPEVEEKELYFLVTDKDQSSIPTFCVEGLPLDYHYRYFSGYTSYSRSPLISLSPGTRKYIVPKLEFSPNLFGEGREIINNSIETANIITDVITRIQDYFENLDIKTEEDFEHSVIFFSTFAKPVYAIRNNFYSFCKNNIQTKGFLYDYYFNNENSVKSSSIISILSSFFPVFNEYVSKDYDPDKPAEIILLERKTSPSYTINTRQVPLESNQILLFVRDEIEGQTFNSINSREFAKLYPVVKEFLFPSRTVSKTISSTPDKNKVVLTSTEKVKGKKFVFTFHKNTYEWSSRSYISETFASDPMTTLQFKTHFRTLAKGYSVGVYFISKELCDSVEKMEAIKESLFEFYRQNPLCLFFEVENEETFPAIIEYLQSLSSYRVVNLKDLPSVFNVKTSPFSKTMFLSCLNLSEEDFTFYSENLIYTKNLFNYENTNNVFSHCPNFFAFVKLLRIFFNTKEEILDYLGMKESDYDLTVVDLIKLKGILNDN